MDYPPEIIEISMGGFSIATYSKAEKTEKIAQEMTTILVVALLFYIWGCHMDKTNHFTLIDNRDNIW